MLADDDEYFPNSNINFAECNKQRDGKWEKQFEAPGCGGRLNLFHEKCDSFESFSFRVI